MRKPLIATVAAVGLACVAGTAVAATNGGTQAKSQPAQHVRTHAEPGDDRGVHVEPGDDRGVHAEPGDDRGNHAEPGDDHRGRGSDNSGRDDSDHHGRHHGESNDNQPSGKG